VPISMIKGSKKAKLLFRWSQIKFKYSRVVELQIEITNYKLQYKLLIKSHGIMD
jgi:hypothetical protein